MKGPPARHEEPKEQFPAVEGIISAASEMKPGDRVVYPNQGVCKVTGVEKQVISGQTLELVRMAREEDGATVMVPKGKVPSIGLRKVATADQIEGVFHYLAAQYDDPELDWKIRHRDNADRLIAGGVLGVAEVVKGLHALSRIRPLPTKEREQYDNARHLLVHEVAVSLVVPAALAEDYIDYALMPPEGTVFKLKPPPKPVVLAYPPTYRQRKRAAAAAAAEEEDDLSLDDLGIDLGAALEGASEAPLPAVEGEAEGTEEHAEGTAHADGEAGDEADGEGEPEEAPEESAAPAKAHGDKLARAARPAPAPKKAAKPAPKPAQAAPKKLAARKPPAAKKAAPAKLAAPAKKPGAAAKKAKPAAKRGGKKK